MISYTLTPLTEFKESVHSTLRCLMISDLKNTGVVCRNQYYLNIALQKWWTYLRERFCCDWKNVKDYWDISEFIARMQRQASVSAPTIVRLSSGLVRFNMPFREWFLIKNEFKDEELGKQSLFIASSPDGKLLRLTDRTPEMLSTLDCQYGDILSELERIKFEVLRDNLLDIMGKPNQLEGFT